MKKCYIGPYMEIFNSEIVHEISGCYCPGCHKLSDCKTCDCPASPIQGIFRGKERMSPNSWIVLLEVFPEKDLFHLDTGNPDRLFFGSKRYGCIFDLSGGSKSFDVDPERARWFQARYSSILEQLVQKRPLRCWSFRLGAITFGFEE